MGTREKILLAALPYLLAGYLWFGLASPAFVTVQDKSNELAEKTREQLSLKPKLLEMSQLKQANAQLEKQIQDLRGSVPKSPDIDILMIDLERMCLESNMDIIGVEPPEKEKAKQAEESGEEAARLSETYKGAIAQMKQQVKAEARVAAGGGGALKPADKAKPSAPVDIGLNKLIKQVTITGDYPSFVELMRKLESYKRVIGINQVELELPPEIGRKKERDVRHLLISFLMTAYYLP